MAASIENTAAHNLHAILSGVRQSSADSYVSGWTDALGVEWDTPEFARRHAEVVNLLQLTMRQIGALPERARQRTERYTYDWWVAVMQPLANWSDGGRRSISIIEQDRLDHLESTAELITAHLGGSAAAPLSSNLTDLATQCQEWLDILSSMDESEISSALRSELISQIQHLSWLIEHADLFGGARVAQEASGVLGSLTQAATTLTAQPETGKRWRSGIVALLAACTVFSSAASGVQGAIEAGTGLAKEITEVVQDIQE
ncbi:hypothetical protein [Streptomyces longhuiensis]|uniref:hypothetical protein n=1 Tax=Streptomyces longhuiensis TaxID=2880933 RepID=UPI001D09C888|nr:hypothetical protein [Streptomyces longhuiensis]UDM01268.1 hypothetical protein LGI35_24855 [Streptomyces longhuiensis]